MAALLKRADRFAQLRTRHLLRVIARVAQPRPIERWEKSLAGGAGRTTSRAN
jgi:hypothetical protein